MARSPREQAAWIKAAHRLDLAVPGEPVLAEELAIFPGMEEVSALLYVNQYAREKAYDVLILDCAPTGESLRFVSLPPTLEWYMKKLFRLERSLLKVARPVAKKMSDLPLPPDRYFANVQSLAQKLEGVDALLKDPRTTTVRLVTNAEKIVIKETQRAFMYFGLYGFTVDAVIVNRLLPDGVQDPFFSKWRRTQAVFLEEARSYFDPVPVFTLPLRDDQVLGPVALLELGKELWGEKDAAIQSLAAVRGVEVRTFAIPPHSSGDIPFGVARGDVTPPPTLFAPDAAWSAAYAGLSARRT